MNPLITQRNFLQHSFLLQYETQRFNQPKIYVLRDMKPVSVGNYRPLGTAVRLHIHGLSSARTSLIC
jgi:hypothetical protein